MFLDYRIRKLQLKVDMQKALAEKLEIAEKLYGRAYYTDKFHSAHCKWVELNGKLNHLKGKKQRNIAISEQI